MTIDELLSLVGLTANDEIPVWDAEAVDEPTKKIKAQNLAASVKALAGLVGEAEFTEALADKASAIVDTASGAIASFPDGAAVAAKDITIGIEPVQSGSGDPSPENVRPISGWTGANVWDDPKYGGTVAWNQLTRNGNFANGTTNWSVVVGSTGSYSVNDGVLTLVTSQSNPYIIQSIGDYALPNHIYVAMCEAKQLESGSMYFTTQFAAPVNNARYTDVNSWVSVVNVFKGRSSIYAKGLVFDPHQKAAGDTIFIKNVQLFDLTQMFGTAIADQVYAMEQTTPGAGVAWFRNLFPKDYYAYNVGEETCVSAVNGDLFTHIPISWQSEAGTVYGGSLDVTTGLLTVTMAEVDLGTLEYNANSAYGFQSADALPGFKPTADNNSEATAICANRQNTSFNVLYAAGTNGNYIAGLPSGKVSISSNISTAAAFKTAMSGVQLVYELATPQTYQLTPTEVEMLLGDNNVWADTGDSTVTYRADTKLYIQKINAPTDDDMIADAQIASGRYFIVGGNLYRSTTTIPAGDIITPGSNCILTNLADALNALNT